MNVKINQEWRDILAPVFDSQGFASLAGYIRREYADPSLTVYPPASRIFAAFDTTPFSSVKAVIIGQDPYHGPGQANGLCFSVNPGIDIPPSLRNIFKEIHDDTGAPVPDNGDLSRWARQGVLLLNSSLTVRKGLAASHSGIGWETVTDAAVRALAEKRSGLVFLLWGSHAIRKGEFIDRTRHLVLTAPHPSPLSAHRGFFGCRHFSRANSYLISQGKEPIQW